MCGRFVSSSTPEELAAYFGVDTIGEAVLQPNWNVAPTCDVYAVLEDGGQRHLDAFFWGLVPWWAKDPKQGAKMINARAETVATKTAFTPSFRSRRCLVPADGFYEWRKTGGRQKQPFFISRVDGEPLALAGLWSVWRGPGRDQPPLRSVTVITTTPNATMAAIHDRMPVVLPPEAWSTWLDPAVDDLPLLERLLVPASDELLVARPCSRAVGDVRNNGPELLVAEEADSLF